MVGQVRGVTWEFQGLFSSEAAAVTACRSATYFVAPARLNIAGADETAAEWPGLRWPLCPEGEPMGQLILVAAARDVLAERHRQISGEGWTPEHDDEHDGGDLAAAAATYCLAVADQLNPLSQGDGGYCDGAPPESWPWAEEWWKPTANDPRRMLVKAGALVLAELERLDRLDDHSEMVAAVQAD